MSAHSFNVSFISTQKKIDSSGMRFLVLRMAGGMRFSFPAAIVEIRKTGQLEEKKGEKMSTAVCVVDGLWPARTAIEALKGHSWNRLRRLKQSAVSSRSSSSFPVRSQAKNPFDHK